MAKPDQWTSERFELEVTEFVQAVSLDETEGPAPPDDPPKGTGPPPYRNTVSMLN